MSGLVTLPYIWDSENACFKVEGKFIHIARRQFLNGDRYALEPQTSSTKGMKFYHARIREIWKNLPEETTSRWNQMVDDGVWNLSPATSPDILRKWALIKCGWRRERVIVCETAAHAKRWVKNMYDDDDPFTITIVEDKTIRIFRAKSQALHGHEPMTPEDLKESKDQVLDLLASLIGTTRGVVQKTGASA